jgi:hypothetical protein
MHGRGVTRVNLVATQKHFSKASCTFAGRRDAANCSHENPNGQRRPTVTSGTLSKGEYTCEVDLVDPVEWIDLVEQFCDASLYQTWAYAAVRWGEKNASWVVLKHRNKPVAIAQLALATSARMKCGVAQLRWGPICVSKEKGMEAEGLLWMADALHREYVQKRGLYLRVLPNAFIGTPRGERFRSAFTQFKQEEFESGESFRTIVVDLSRPLGEIRKQLDQKWRNQLNRAERNGLLVVDGADDLPSVERMYHELLRRKRFMPGSNLNELLEVNRRLSPKEKLRIFVCKAQGSPIACVIVSAMGDSGIYLVGASNSTGLQLKGSYFLQWHAIKWLKESGAMFYNLGGINPESNPGVYHFKKGLSGQDVQYIPPLCSCANPLSWAVWRTGKFFRLKGRHALRRFLRWKW